MKKVHRFIMFNQKARLKSYIEMNTELKKKQKMISKVLFQVRFIIYIKIGGIYEDIEARDVEVKLNTSNFELDRPFLKGKKNRLFV